MKSWLPVLLDKLPESPVLALSSSRNLALGAVYDRQGRLLAGGLKSDMLSALASEEARNMAPGECRLLASKEQLCLECLAPEETVRRFWSSALDNQKGAWASWLLTMPVLDPGGLKLTRHILSAFGPWTTPRLPEELRDHWSLMPLNPGLGRLFVIGDDSLALELAALAGRTGLTTSWLTTGPESSPELAEAKSFGNFDHYLIKSWADLTAEDFEELGLKEGVRLVITAILEPALMEVLQEISPSYLALAGEAAASETAPGLFPQAVTTTQKALGLIGEMLKVGAAIRP